MRFLPRTRGGALWRAALACVLVMGFAAAATTVAGLLKVKDFVDEINLSKALSDADVTLPTPGQPETLLLVGSDARYGQGDVESNTDTMMLVRIDDSSSTINMLSIPRDLDVDIPNYGPSKLNAAWEIGGSKLLIQMLKEQVFPGTGFYVNRVINITFTAFSDLVDAIGCVYTMVDHRYYNYNNGDGATDYSNIDIQPGYQKLCGGVTSASGDGALAFVRFRHTDSDLVREMRQQDFLRWAKSQFSNTGELEDNEAKLLNIFGRDTQSDQSIHSTKGLIELFNLAVDANGHQTKDITFQPGPPVAIGNESALSNDVADSVAEYKEFITPTVAPSPTSTTSSSTSTKTKKTAPPKTKLNLGGLEADPGDGDSQATQLHEHAFPVYYPKYIVYGSQYCFSIAGTVTPDCYDDAEPESAYTGSYPRSYTITSRGNKPYAAYAMTLELDANAGEYYTIEGTTWRYPPILSGPAEVLHLNGKTLDVYENSGATTGDINLVAWRTKKAVYWISNTLDDAIPNHQMIAMAANFVPAP